MLIQISVIIWNRVLYVSRSIRGKLVFQILVVLFVHIVVLLSPLSSKEYLHSNSALKTFYLLQCLIFVFSGLQVKYGYDPRTQATHFLTRNGYTRLPATTFKIYRAIPFVFELRTMLDWVCFETSLDLYMWFKLEDLYANLFMVRSEMEYRRAYRKILGGYEAQPRSTKFLSGVLVFAVLMIVVVGPIYLFSTANPGLSTNLVLTAEVSFGIQNNGAKTKYYELFSSSQDVSTRPLTLKEYQELQFMLPRQLETDNWNSAQVFSFFFFFLF